MWFKVDDKLWGNPKWLATPLRARALWVTAGSWCAANEQDGVISRTVLRQFANRTLDAEALVKSGLWEHHEDGYRFHDWDDYQPSKEQVRADREASKERQRRWREKRMSRRDNGVSNGVSHGVSHGAPTRPDPTSLSLPLSVTSPTTAQPDKPPNGETRDEDPTRTLAAELLGIEPNDPSLDSLPTVLRANNVRIPSSWLRATAATGDLGPLLADTPAERDPWANVRQLTPEHPYAGNEPLPDPTPMPRGLLAGIHNPTEATS